MDYLKLATLGKKKITKANGCFDRMIAISAFLSFGYV